MIFDCFNRVAILHIDVAVVLPEEILAVRHDICISVLHSLTLSERDVRVTPVAADNREGNRPQTSQYSACRAWESCIGSDHLACMRA